MEETKTTVTETKQEDKGLSQIQPNEKKSWWSIAFIWVGTMICIPMLMVGGIFGGTLTMGTFSPDLDGWDATVAIGAVCGTAIGALTGYSFADMPQVYQSNSTGEVKGEEAADGYQACRNGQDCRIPAE